MLLLSIGMKISDICVINSGIYCRDDSEGDLWAFAAFLEN